MPSFPSKRGNAAKLYTKLQKGMLHKLLERCHWKSSGTWLASRSSEVQITLCPNQQFTVAAPECIRCNHFARTSIQEITEDTICVFVEWQESSTGKQTSVHPCAVPPPLSMVFFSVFQCLLDVYQNWVHRVFFWWHLTHFETTVSLLARRCSASPMVHSQWVRLIRQVLADFGRLPNTLKRYTFNTLRRFSPTAANVMGFNDKIAQAVDSWPKCSSG